MDAEQYMKAIWAMLVVTVIDGVFVGHYFYEGENEIIFVPLLIGFVLIGILYTLIEKRGNLIAGKKVDKYR